jgi:hypothetical protein
MESNQLATCLGGQVKDLLTRTSGGLRVGEEVAEYQKAPRTRRVGNYRSRRRDTHKFSYARTTRGVAQKDFLCVDLCYKARNRIRINNRLSPYFSVKLALLFAFALLFALSLGRASHRTKSVIQHRAVP